MHVMFQIVCHLPIVHWSHWSHCLQVLVQAIADSGAKGARACRLGGQIVVPSRLMDRPEIVQVAQRIGRSPAQVILRWGVQRGVSILPKSDLPAQMQVRPNC